MQVPEPGDVAQKAGRPGDAALVREVGGEGLVGDERLVELDADERPRTDTEEDRPRPCERRSGNGGTGVVCRPGDDGGLSEPCLIGGLRRDAAQLRAGRNDLREDVGRDVQTLEQIAGPAPFDRVVALGGRGVRQLGRPAAAQPVVEQVRHEQDPVGGCECRTLLRGQRGEFEDRVDRQELDPRAVVELACGNTFERRRERLGTSRVAIVNGILEQAIVGVDQPEVDAPRVDGDRVDSRFTPGRAQPVQDVAAKIADVPAQRTGRSDRLVREPVGLGHGERPSVEPTECHSTALSPEIDRRHRRHQLVSPSL